jgi:hypothetical protein
MRLSKLFFPVFFVTILGRDLLFVPLTVESDQVKHCLGDVDSEFGNLHGGSSLYPVIGVG